MSDAAPDARAVADSEFERRLVERARAGDGQALGQIYQRHVDRVYSFLLFRVHDADLAEDLTQDVFIQALRGLANFDWRGSLAPWLLRIARNTLVDHWRRTARRPEKAFSAIEAGDDDDEEGWLDKLSDQPDDGRWGDLDPAWDREQIATAATRLTDLQQQVIALRFAAGLSIRETAEAMGRSEGAVKNLQHHALRALRHALIGSEVPA